MRIWSRSRRFARSARHEPRIAGKRCGGWGYCSLILCTAPGCSPSADQRFAAYFLLRSSAALRRSSTTLIPMLRDSSAVIAEHSSHSRLG